MVGQKEIYVIPSVIDKDGDKMIVFASLGENPLPSFIQFSHPQFTFQPSSSEDVGVYVVTLTLTDLGEPPLS